MKLNEKNIFLLDGIGAALSSATTGLLLPVFSEWIGLRANTLRLLGLIGFAFAVYSLTCFLALKKPPAFTLLAIMVANSLYFMLTLSIALWSSELSPLGRTYFYGESAILAGVVWLEATVWRNSFYLPNKNPRDRGLN